MKPDSDPEGLPSYSESISPSQDSLPSLPVNRASARTSLISSLLRSEVIPRLQHSAPSDLSSMTLLLVASNVSALQSPTSTSIKGVQCSTNAFPGEKILGFPMTEDLTLIRLCGEEHTIEFWRQPAVIREFEEQLCEFLRDGGYVVVRDEGDGRNRTSAEWKTVEARVLANGHARTVVYIKEICLRVENAMGLYETRSGKALVVKVDVGG